MSGVLAALGRAALGAALAMAPGMAIAQSDCPVRADLAGGIRFDIDGGDTETFTLVKPGLLRAIYSAAGNDEGEVIEVLLAKGLYVVKLRDIADGKTVEGSLTILSFPLATSDLPDAVPGTTWNVSPAKRKDGDIRAERQEYAFGAPITKTYGACTYEVIPVDINYPDETGPYRDLVHYLPALGLSYLAGYTDNDGPVTFDYTGISAVE